MINTVEELIQESQTLASGGVAYDMAVIAEEMGEPLEPINIAEYCLDSLYDQIQFETTEATKKQLIKALGHYV